MYDYISPCTRRTVQYCEFVVQGKPMELVSSYVHLGHLITSLIIWMTTAIFCSVTWLKYPKFWMWMLLQIDRDESLCRSRLQSRHFQISSADARLSSALHLANSSSSIFSTGCRLHLIQQCWLQETRHPTSSNATAAKLNLLILDFCARQHML